VTTDSGLAASVRASDAVQPNRSIEHKGKVLKLFGAQILSVHHHLQCIDPDNLLMRLDLSLCKPRLCIRIVGVPSIDETGTTAVRRFYHLLDRFGLAGLKLALQVNEGPISTIETHARRGIDDAGSMEMRIETFEWVRKGWRVQHGLSS
jgi:hypothetical protein